MQTLFTNTKYNYFSGPPSVVQSLIWNKEWMLQLVPSLLLVHCYAMGINLSMTPAYALKQDQLCMITLCPPASGMRTLLDTSLVVCLQHYFYSCIQPHFGCNCNSTVKNDKHYSTQSDSTTGGERSLNQHLKMNLLIEFLYQFNFSFLHPNPTLRD